MISYLNYSSSYTVVNNNNMYNCFIAILMCSNDDMKRNIIDNIKIHIGLTFYNNLKIYIYRKMNKSTLLEFFD